MNEKQFIAKTFHGLEEVLAQELSEICAKDITLLNRAVSFRGNNELMYKANYHLRTALRILEPILSERIINEYQLYDAVKSINWQQYLNNNETLYVDSVVSSSYFNHSRFVSQKVKDAIVDQFKELTGRRPSVDNNDPTVRINVHIARDKLVLSLDSSGDSLHKRGYRVEQGNAPINEVLAAGLILLTGWNGNKNFIDPMCGSGTLPIEAVLIAYNIPPGTYRKKYGFENWHNFNPELFKEIIDHKEEKKNINFSIIGSDISKKAIQIARRNASNALLTKKLSFSLCSIDNFSAATNEGTAVINPPYGERLKDAEINSLYSYIGDSLKKRFSDYDVWIISSNKNALKKIGLRTSKRLTLFNGPLECKYHKFEIYEGSGNKRGL